MTRGRSRAIGIGAAVVLASLVLFGLRQAPTAAQDPTTAQDPTATIEVVARRNSTGATVVYRALADGTADSTPAYESTDPSFQVAPGCWVVVRQVQAPFVAGQPERDRSRPYFPDAEDQQHAVCLEPGERFVLDTGPVDGPGAFVPRRISFMEPGGGLVRDSVTVTYSFQQSSNEPTINTLEIAPDSIFLLPFNVGPVEPGCSTVLAAESPNYTFPGFVGGTNCGTEGVPDVSGNFIAVGQAIEQPYSPAIINLDLEHSAIPDGQNQELYQVRVEYADTGWPVFWRQQVGAPTELAIDIGAGCYVVRLWVHGKAMMMVDVERAFRSIPVCLDVGQSVDLSSGDVVLANVQGDQPFIPIRTVDADGAAVPAVQVDTFHPRQDLTPDQLRAFDHTTGDARGEFNDSALTDADGRSLLPNYTECQVATLIAPSGWQFTTGRYKQRTVCEYDAPVVELFRDDNPPPPTETFIAGAVTTVEGEPVSSIVIDLFSGDQDGNRVEYLRSAVTDLDGRFRFELDGPGCRVITFIAPEARVWQDSGSRWVNRSHCLEAGQQVEDANAVLAGPASQPSSVGGTISDTSGQNRPGVKVDLFEMTGDGSRGRWIEQTVTGGDGEFRFFFDLSGRTCLVLTYIAPEGETWVESGSPWLNRPLCVDPGEALSSDALLTSARQ